MTPPAETRRSPRMQAQEAESFVLALDASMEKLTEFLGSHFAARLLRRGDVWGAARQRIIDALDRALPQPQPLVPKEKWARHEPTCHLRNGTADSCECEEWGPTPYSRAYEDRVRAQVESNGRDA